MYGILRRNALLFPKSLISAFGATVWCAGRRESSFVGCTSVYVDLFEAPEQYAELCCLFRGWFLGPRRLLAATRTLLFCERDFHHLHDGGRQHGQPPPQQTTDKTRAEAARAACLGHVRPHQRHARRPVEA